jgi:hypothetical protein
MSCEEFGGDLVAPFQLIECEEQGSRVGAAGDGNDDGFIDGQPEFSPLSQNHSRKPGEFCWNRSRPPICSHAPDCEALIKTSQTSNVIKQTHFVETKAEFDIYIGKLFKPDLRTRGHAHES